MLINGSGGRYDKPLLNGKIVLNTNEPAPIVGGKLARNVSVKFV